MKRSPHPRERFFEQAVLNQDLGQGLLELAGLGLEFLDLVGGRLTGRVASQRLLAGLQKLLRPPGIEVLIDAFLAAEFGNADLTAKAFQHDADLLFGRMVPTGISTDVPDCLLRTIHYALACLSHRCSSLGLR
jgi:hypothetical protein